MLTDNPAATLILVVEDDDSHAELIQRSFADAREEFRLEIVGTISDARIAIVRHSPGLVLTDYRMPDGDGRELVEMAAGSWPVIMMTSHGNEQLAVESLKAGAQDYIVKSPETFYSLPRIVYMSLREWHLIQDRKKINEAVSRGKREWEQTFDAVPDLIAIIDTHHTLIRVNRAMADRCGFAPDEMVGRKCFEVVHGFSKPLPFCSHIKMMQDGREYEEEVEEKHLNGFFHVSVSPLYDPDGSISSCVHVARDITERKKAEEERRELDRNFQQTQKLESLGVLAGGIAHDFNNILTIILGHCFMAKDDADAAIAEKSHVAHIESAANRAADLCRQMLAYAGKSPLLYVRINLWLLVDEIIRMLQSAIKKNVSIQLDLKRDVPEISGDNAQIQQVVMNMVINAAEAIGDNNGTIKVVLYKAIIQVEQKETDFAGNIIPARSYACLEVSDDGCGMDELTQKRIFEPFYTTKFTGRGLGMSAILGIIKSHDGALQLISNLGVGTTFKVFLPLSDSPELVAVAPSALIHSAVAAHRTVLLVDDEESLRNIGSALLKAMGFSVITAANGRKALDIYRARGAEIHMILLDLIMPEMGGIDTYYEFRKMSADVPIVICSGYGVEGIADNINADKYFGTIQKPYKPEHLRSAMLRLLDIEVEPK